MRKIIFFALFLFGCSIIKRPGRSVDSTIVTRDSFHTVISPDRRDSVTYRKREVAITHESHITFKPLFWYTLAAGLTFAFYLFFIKK
jgi:hypothetical protein